MKANPYTIVIADDDAMLRIALRSMLPWEQHGYRIVGEAADGSAALRLCRRLQPDILITDMKMPELDGIGLLQQLQSLQARPIAVALSGYDEFSLVRQAMRLGAADYLLKLELNAPRLLQCLQALPLGRMTQTPLPTTPPADSETVLRNLVSRFYPSAADMDRQLRQAGVRFETTPVYCLLLHAGDWFRFEDADEEEIRTLQQSMRNIAVDIASECMGVYCAAGKTGELYLFAALKKAYAGREDLVRRTARRLRDMLKSYLDIRCVVAVGSGAADAEGLDRACQQAAQAIRRRFCMRTDGVLWWDEVALIEPAASSEAVARHSSEVCAGINTLDWPRTEQALDRLMEAFSHAGLSQQGMLQAVAELQNGVCECLERCGRASRQTLAHSYRDLRAMLTLDSASDCIQWLHSVQEDLALFFAAEEQGAAGSGVQQAIALIEERYAQPLSLRELAEELQLSPGYLSLRIKQQTGLNFSEYLMQVRLRRAQQLLRQTDTRIVQVAAMVGYTDQFYFSRLFKRSTGMTPSEYRRQGGM